MHIEKGSAMRKWRKASVRAAGSGQGRSNPSSPSSRAGAGGRAFFGIALARSAAARATPTAHAKAASAHLLGLTVDQGLVAAGVAAAIGSASFAGFMIARDNSHPLFGGIEHLMIFAQPIGGSESRRRLLAERAQTRSVDYDATGSINRPPAPPAGAGAAAPRDAGMPEPAGLRAKGYVLRFTRKGAMLVDGPKGSYAAAPGVVLPDLGRILAIQNRNGRWVVQTENGLIAEPAP